MSQADILNLRKDVQNLALNIQEMYMKNTNDEYVKAKYLLIASLFKRLLLLNNEKDIRTFLSTIRSEVSPIRKEYDSLYGAYQKSLDTSLIKQINLLGHKVNIYNQVINIINGYLNKEKEKKNPVKEVSTSKGFDAILIKYSDEIIELSNKLKKLDPNTSEAESIRKKIYDLKIQRETEIYNIIGDSYIKQIGELESIEMRIINSSNKRISDYEVDSNRYVQELKSTIDAINEYYFIDELSSHRYYEYDNNVSDGKNNSKIRERFLFYINKFNSLMISLFGNKNYSFTVNGERISIDNFLSYLETCNLTEGFDTYKSKFEKVKVGNERIDKHMYENTLSFINKCIEALCDIASKKIGDKKIVIKDCSPKSDELMNERLRKIREIYNIVSTRKIKGEKHV